MKRVKRRPNRSPVLKKFERTPHHSRTVVIAPEVEEVFPPPKEREREREEPEDPAYCEHPNPFSRGSKSHRCTYYRPSNEDFGGLTELALPPNDYYQNLLQKICTDEPGTTKPELKNACEGAIVQTRSAFVEPASGLKLDENEMADLVGENQWQTIDSISDVDYFLPRVPSSEPRVETPVEMPKDNESGPSIESRIQISTTPRIKRIAEKYSKFKRENVEVRKLEERVVCLEYDIFNLNAADPAVPVQKMRAFFCIKMKDFGECNSKGAIPLIPSGVKRNFNLEDKDLQKLNKKEIEIIDDEIPENRSLLEDLKRVLRRKQALENKKKQPTLDLMCLYEMAKRESPPKNSDYSNTNLLSKAELQEIKDLIMKKCDSSVHGINRRTVKLSSADPANDAPCILSSSLINELMREAQEVEPCGGEEPCRHVHSAPMRANGL